MDVVINTCESFACETGLLPVARRLENSDRKDLSFDARRPSSQTIPEERALEKRRVGLDGLRTLR